MRRKTNQSGLTLIEILVVVLILAILAVTLKFGMSRLQSQNNERAVRSLFVLLDNALQEYHASQGHFPTFVIIDPDVEDPNVSDETHWVTFPMLYQELETVPEARDMVEDLDVKWGRDSKITDDQRLGARNLDPWSRPLLYFYFEDAVFPLLRSLGPDGLFNTPDDILNR